MIKKICKVCKKEFWDYPSRKKIFCSVNCRNSSIEYNKYLFQKGHKLINGGFTGHKHTEISKRKIIKTHKGKKYNLGKHWNLSKETRIKMSKSAKRGKDCHLWKGGITPENVKIRTSIETRLWREAVFARDNWTCQKCHTRGYKLQSHHIQSFAKYPELRFVIDNGITLCKFCHLSFHKKYRIK